MSPLSQLLAQPPIGSIILARPCSELSSYVFTGQVPPLELIMRAIKTLALAILRGHLYDRVAIANAKGIVHSFSRKVEVMTCEEIQRRYPFLLEKAHLLILKKTETLPKDFAKEANFERTVNASTIGNYFFNRPLSTIADFLKSHTFNQLSLDQIEPEKKDKKRKLEHIFKEGSPEEFINFKVTFFDFYQKWVKKNYPFDIAVENKNIKLARYLAKTEDMDEINHLTSDYTKRTPLQKALALGDLETIRILKDRGVKINALDREGNNMMHYAALSGNVDVVNLVSNWKYLEGYRKAYHHISIPEVFWAAQSGNYNCFLSMLANTPSLIPLQTPRPPGPWENQASVLYASNNALNPLKHHSVHGTILHYAVKGGNWRIIRYLIENGVDPLKGNDIYEYPIHIAANQGDLAIVQYLWPICKAKGMKIDDCPENGTLLYRAIENGQNLELVKYLVAEGASITGQKSLKQVLDLIQDSHYPNLEIKNYILNLRKQK